jgi:hypothetical protein
VAVSFRAVGKATTVRSFIELLRVSDESSEPAMFAGIFVGEDDLEMIGEDELEFRGVFSCDEFLEPCSDTISRFKLYK